MNVLESAGEKTRCRRRARVVLPLEEGPEMPITRAWEVIVPVYVCNL